MLCSFQLRCRVTPAPALVLLVARPGRQLLYDPTHTTTIRRGLLTAWNKRMRELQQVIYSFLVESDGLDLRPLGSLVLHAGEFGFNTDPQKLEAFNAWFAQQVAGRVFLVPPGTPAARPWVAEYVESAYRRGLVHAYISTVALRERPLPRTVIEITPLEEFLISSFAMPVTVEKVRLLYLRAWEELKGVTSEMGVRLSRILAQGLVDGTGPLALARQMNTEIRDLSRVRALRIARTEIIRAHAEGQLDAFERLGVEQLGLLAEWLTAGDDHVCPFCRAKEGKTFTVAGARGLIPLHPNCVLGDSLIEVPQILAVTRAKYCGKIVHLKTIAGRHLAVTENHVLLTRKGWRLAKAINKGDQLIDASSFDCRLGKYPNEQHRISPIEEVFESLAKSFPEHLRTIAGPSSQDFHGDGGSMNPEIHIVLSDRILGNQLDTLDLEKVEKFSLMAGYIDISQSLSLHSESSLSFLLKRLAASADRFVSSASVPAILARGTEVHHQPIRLGDSSDGNVREHQAGADDIPTTSEGVGDLLQTLPVGVAFDEVVEVQIVEPVLRGIFVFDVWTHSSMYSLDGVLSSNCRCTWLPKLAQTISPKTKT